jgi:hypothetical protein
MIAFLIVVAIIATVLAPYGLISAYTANPLLNTVILSVLVIGIAYNLFKVVALEPEVAWFELYRRNRPDLASHRQPKLLAPMATMLGERKGRVSLSATSMRSLLDGIASRLEESREISRYMIGLLIFLGLLGTFWGLLETVSAVSGVISGLTTATDTGTLFNNLRDGLQRPLGGMGTAFGTSLFGLAGSLVLGFLDLQAGQAQNRFYNDLEEWLSGMTRLGTGGPGDGEQSVPSFIQALLEQTADNLENLQRTMARFDEGRVQNTNAMSSLVDRLTALTDQMRTEQTLIARLAENQNDLKPILQRLADTAAKGGFGFDETTRAHIRNLDVHMARLVQDNAAGRAQMAQDIRNEIRLLARTLAANVAEPR